MENFFLEMNQAETRIACGSHICLKWIGTKWAFFIDASYQVSVHKAKMVSEEKNLNKQLRQERMIRPLSTFIQYL